MLTTAARPVDAAGRPRSPAAMPGYHAGRPPRNKGVRYPADPPRLEEIVAVMRKAGMGVHGARMRGLIVVLWRAGLRISEALDLVDDRPLDPGRGALLVRQGKGGKRREVGMDKWGWEQLRPWIEHRPEMPIGALFCVIKWSDLWATLVRSRSTNAAPAPRARSRRSPAFRTAPAPSCARCGDGAGGRTVECDPASARPRGPRRHLCVLAADRQHRGDQHGPLSPRTDDACERRAEDVAEFGLLIVAQSGSGGPSSTH
jgi:hypothetical protein